MPICTKDQARAKIAYMNDAETQVKYNRIGL